MKNNNLTYLELRKSFITDLSEIYNEKEALSIFYILVKKLFNLNRIEFQLDINNIVNEKQIIKFFNVKKELLENKPIQYILAETEFYGYKFKVNKNVLIPRQETEELVDLIINENINSIEPISIIDIGTGSGCIAISLSKKLINSNVIACDISSKALNVASKNAKLNNSNVQFINIDILNRNLKLNIKKLDIVVSNPPYIIPSQIALMSANILSFEPHIALFVEQDNPLIFYEAILKFCIINLKSNGKVYFEINELYSKQIEDLFKRFNYIDIQIIKDINNRFRIAKATKDEI